MSEPKPLNPWDYKPWWCQPWTIVITSIILISGSWLLFKVIWFTILVAIPVLTWMSFFVFIWPQLMIRSGILASYKNKN